MIIFADDLHMGQSVSRMDQAKFLKVCLPQILLDPFLNTLSHMGYACIDLHYV